MAITLTDEQMRFLRLRAQGLVEEAGDESATVAQIVSGMGGIQAQEVAAAALALRVRGRNLVAGDVEQARARDRSIVRTWGWRGTLHFLATEDLSWLLPLLGPVFAAAYRRRREELGLDEETCQSGLRLLRQLLAGAGPLTREELVGRLTAHGLRLEGQARPHLLMRAALEGLICFGPDKGAEPTYVLLEDWISRMNRPAAYSDANAYAELTRRYLLAYGPATPQDQAAWSGLPLVQVRQGWQALAGQLIEVETGTGTVWMLKEAVGGLDEQPFSPPSLRLLPRFDIYLLGYQRRDLILPERYARRVNAGGGMLHPTIVCNGRVVGTWKSVRKGQRIEVRAESFEPEPALTSALLESEVADMARFLGVAHTWQMQTA